MCEEEDGLFKGMPCVGVDGKRDLLLPHIQIQNNAMSGCGQLDAARCLCVCVLLLLLEEEEEAMNEVEVIQSK